MADALPPTSPRQTSRGQVSRIDRGYLQTPNRLQIARRWLVVACLGIGVGWAAWGAFDQPLHHAPGQVAAVHAKWERDCQACHVPFAPIKDDTWLSNDATRRAMDAKCEACHRGAAHHPLQVAAEVGSCASCHADHRGREADISRVADRTCTACHASIASHRIADADIAHSTADSPITRFDNEHHPAFAGLDKDPGRLKFSHGRHMRHGLTFGPTTTEARGRWTYAMLAPEDRRRYQPAAADANDPVQLACASCHEFGPSTSGDSVRSVSVALASAKPGAYALPVTFERHCAACHALPYDGVPVPRDNDTVGTPGELVLPNGEAAPPRIEVRSGVGSVSSDQNIPHGLDAAGMAMFLESRFLRAALAADPALLTGPLPRRPLPTGSDARNTVPAALGEAVGDKVRRSLTFVRGTCEKCHEVQPAQIDDATHLLGHARGLTDGSAPWFEVGRTGVPDIWLRKARFDHGPHRGFDCRECHAAAYPDEDADASTAPGSPLDNGLVMIAGRESCVTCHAPAAHDPSTGRMAGGARFDCVECHGYHGLGPHERESTRITTASRRGAIAHDGSE